MENIVFSPITETLVVSSGKPDDTFMKDLNARAYTSIKSLLGDKNEIWLGKPKAFNLNELGMISGKPLPANLQILNKNYDLVVLHFACSFRPAPECEFVESSIRIHLGKDSNYREQPYAYDIFPRNVELPVSYKRKFSLTPEFKISFEKVMQIEASAFTTEVSNDYLKYEPEITAFGVGDCNPGWDLNKTKHRSIRGVKDLFALVCKPKGAKILSSFTVSGWVQTDIGNIPLSTFILSGSDKPLATELYELD